MMVLLGLVESYIRALTLTGLEPLMAPYHQYFSIVADARGDLDCHTIYPSLNTPPSCPIPTLCLCSCPSPYLECLSSSFVHLENYSDFKTSSRLWVGIRRQKF